METRFCPHEHMTEHMSRCGPHASEKGRQKYERSRMTEDKYESSMQVDARMRHTCVYKGHCP